MSEVAQKINFDAGTGDAGLGDAEQNLLWKPHNIQVVEKLCGIVCNKNCFAFRITN